MLVMLHSNTERHSLSRPHPGQPIARLALCPDGTQECCAVLFRGLRQEVMAATSAAKSAF